VPTSPRARKRTSGRKNLAGRELSTGTQRQKIQPEDSFTGSKPSEHRTDAADRQRVLKESPNLATQNQGGETQRGHMRCKIRFFSLKPIGLQLKDGGHRSPPHLIIEMEIELLAH
jgi:hypothetical protein